jgi:pimeloyl-ACP methyl ester carboxylesterase
MRRSALAFASLVALSACHRHDSPPIVRDPAESARAPAWVDGGADRADPAEAVAGDAVAPVAAVDDAPARVERLEVAGDTPASMVRAKDGRAPRLVFLPGVCSNAYAYLLSFPEAARAHGGIVAIDGDRPCAGAGREFRSFSWDPAKQDARLRAALAASGADPADVEGLTLVGYSAGADIGELMVQRWPKRYARVVLIGAPSDPSPPRLSHAQAVVTMSCSRDVPGRMRDGARRIAATGVPATYLEMPGCTHGNIADGEEIFTSAFDWLAQNAH